MLKSISKFDSVSTKRRQEDRFIIPDVKASIPYCLCRNVNMRFTTYELHILDISRNGLRLYTPTKKLISFKNGDKVSVTLDLNGHIFPRPIHIMYTVKNVVLNNGCQEFGLEFLGFHSENSKDIYHESIDIMEREGSTYIKSKGVQM